LAGVRIAILGDTHMPRGARALPDACVEEVRASDLVVHTGDFTGIEALELIESIGPPLVAVHGNVDVPAVAARLPQRASFDAGAGITIAVVHDGGPRAGRLARLRRQFPRASAVLFGHSHLPLHEEDDGFQIFNPGSPTERRRAPRHSMGVGVADGDGLRLSHVWF
jgi:putative phosphoesterase